MGNIKKLIFVPLVPPLVKVNSAKDEEGSGSEAKKFRKVDLLQDEEKLGKLLEMSKRFLMPDLTVEVENLLIKNINIGNLEMFARLAENFDCEKLIDVGVKLMMREGDVGLAVDKGMIQSMPKFSDTLLKALGRAHDDYYRDRRSPSPYRRRRSPTPYGRRSYRSRSRSYSPRRRDYSPRRY